MTLSEELQWRGFVNQTTYEDISEIDKEPITFYFGVDPSADSMQIGNLGAAMMVRHFINHGHKAILLVGGATGMIGDPDGKKDERNLKTIEEINNNKAKIAEQYRRVFAGAEFEIVDNYDWFKDINYLSFLRDVGKHVPLSQMLGRDFVQARIGEDGSGISYAEFSYSLIQGYDFLHLYREKGATLQLAGADQWGNSITGVQMIRRLENADAHVWTAPLIINKATGKKFGKTEGGAVWLDANKTSVYAFYQFWLNVDDEGAGDYLKVYTLLDKEVVNDLLRRQQDNPGARDIQKTLAYEVTKLVHGEQAANNARAVTNVLFGGSNISELDESAIDLLANEIPVAEAHDSLIDALVNAAVVASKGEARRLMQGGAISVNGEKISKDQSIQGLSLVKKGKNSFLLIR